MAANILQGKNKKDFVRNQDCGDNLVITNAKKIKLSGNKMTKEFWEKMMADLDSMSQEKFDRLVREFDEECAGQNTDYHRSVTFKVNFQVSIPVGYEMGFDTKSLTRNDGKVFDNNITFGYDQKSQYHVETQEQQNISINNIDNMKAA